MQLLHKLSIHASDGPMKLMKVWCVCSIFLFKLLAFSEKVIKNPITDHLPAGCLKIGTSYHADQVMDVRKYAEDKPIVFVVGAMAHGKVGDPLLGL